MARGGYFFVATPSQEVKSISGGAKQVENKCMSWSASLELALS